MMPPASTLRGRFLGGPSTSSPAWDWDWDWDWLNDCDCGNGGEKEWMVLLHRQRAPRAQLPRIASLESIATPLRFAAEHTALASRFWAASWLSLVPAYSAAHVSYVVMMTSWLPRNVTSRERLCPW
jgi:hypothetical protein